MSEAYPSFESIAANSDYFCHGCHTQSVPCRECLADGREDEACECDDYQCSDGHDCYLDWVAVNQVRQAIHPPQQGADNAEGIA